ncbi:MAG: hypothetical protein ACRD3L_02260 [Terriglobales bacterium]
MRTGKVCLGQIRTSFPSIVVQMKPQSRTALSTRAALLMGVALLFWGSLALHATVTSVSVQAPNLTGNGAINLTSPVHFQATAESDMDITGYVVYVDGQVAYQNFLRMLDAWVVVAPGNHSIYVKAWDSGGSLFSTATYGVGITGLAPPSPPVDVARMTRIAEGPGWVVDNNPGVGGQCNDGSIGSFQSSSDPNTSNSPNSPRSGQLFTLTSRCQYDDSLFYMKDSRSPYPYARDTNFLWDFWFYIPATTQPGSIQALEFDLFQAVQLSDGVHEFMFGSQCNYASNQWQLWLPKNGGLTWVNAGLSPCQFSSGTWHHATYFLQRVTADGYQKIPASFGPSSDTNNSLRFGTLTIDGNTMYLGDLANSTIPNPKWSQVLGVQHQLDSAQTGVTIQEYVDKESLLVW